MNLNQVNRDLTDHGHLLVRRAILRNDWISDALLDLAAGSQTEWTPQEWNVLLKELRESSEKIEDWLVLNS